MVMTVLRDNKDSLMAMLEAFVHDPLISWRLLAQSRMSASPLVRLGEPPHPKKDIWMRKNWNKDQPLFNTGRRIVDQLAQTPQYLQIGQWHTQLRPPPRAYEALRICEVERKMIIFRNL